MTTYANVYDRKDRANWWIYWRDPATGRKKQAPTEFLKSDPTGRMKALQIAREKSKDYASRQPAATREGWHVWVPAWLKQTFRYNELTWKRYDLAWRKWDQFLTEQKVPSPRDLKYKHAAEYVQWRSGQNRKNGKSINPNTAVTEVKVMSRIMREAHLREYCTSNPFYQLGLKRINVREKPELTDQEIAVLRAELQKREGQLPLPKRWMTICFEIALHQGCRLSETVLPLDHVDFARNVIVFTAKGKNGVPKIYPTALLPDLKPLLWELKQLGCKRTFDPPRAMSKLWWNLRRDLGLSHLSFHSTRVTVITRGARAGVTQQQMMRYVGHASETVHRIYIRLNAEDVHGVANSLRFGNASRPSATPAAPEPATPNESSSIHTR